VARSKRELKYLRKEGKIHLVKGLVYIDSKAEKGFDYLKIWGFGH